MNDVAPLWESVSTWTYAGFRFAWVAGIWGGLFALIVLVINLTARRWLSSAQMGILWGLVLIRMVLPIAPVSDLSAQHGLLRFADSYDSDADAAMYYRVEDSATANPLSAAHNEWRADDSVHAGDVVRITSHENRLSVRTAERTWDEWFELYVPPVWLVGAMAVLLTTLVTHRRFSRRLRQVPVCDHPRLLALWEQCCAEFALLRRVPVLLTDEVSHPSVTGLIRPALLLPTDSTELSDRQLRLVMAHELTHIQRWDIAVNWALVLVRAAQWWNPFYWLAMARFGSLREQSRDAIVLRSRIESDDDGSLKREYSDLLLTLASHGGRRGWRVMVPVPVSLLGFFRGPARTRRLAGRLKAIRSATRPQHGLHRLLIGGLIVVVAVIGLTDAAPTNSRTEAGGFVLRVPEAWSINHFPNSVNGDYVLVGDDPTEQWESAEYDITAAVAMIRNEFWTDSEAVDPDADESVRMQVVSLLQIAMNLSFAPDDSADNGSDGKRQPNFELRKDDDRWLVRLDAPVLSHERLKRSLQAWDQSGLGQITLRMWMITSATDCGSTAGITWSSVVTSSSTESTVPDRSMLNAGRGIRADAQNHSPSATVSIQEHVALLVATLSPSQLHQFLATAQQEPRASLMTAPTVTVFNGQEAGLFTGVERPFVVGFEETDTSADADAKSARNSSSVDADEADGNSLVPRIGIAREGVSVEFTATLTADLASVDLHSRLDATSILDVTTFTFRLHGQDATIQCPLTRHMQIHTAPRINSGDAFVIGIPPGPDRTDYFFAVLTPQVISRGVLREDH